MGNTNHSDRLAEGDVMQALETVNKKTVHKKTVNKISFKNILCFTDFTEASEAAMAYAVGLARHYNAHLYPAYACDQVTLTESAGPDIVQEMEDTNRERLTALAKNIDVPCTPLFILGSVEMAAPGWIAQNGIDLVVMGTHGRKGLKHFLMGSVAEAIYRHTTCPVLTVGPHVNTRPNQDFKVKSILFPTDLKEHAKFAAQYALSLAQESDAPLTLMHVVPLDEALGHDHASLTEKAYQKLSELVPEEIKDRCKFAFLAKVGDPVKELLGYAATELPDLIVLGLPPGKKFSDHFRTGVAYNIVAASPCPVLTVRDVLSDN
jgi:nucleotide-binding universal stress UspA family protein